MKKALAALLIMSSMACRKNSYLRLQSDPKTLQYLPEFTQPVAYRSATDALSRYNRSATVVSILRKRPALPAVVAWAVF
ncbi:MAG: hypothetical protein U5L96_11360 [Owenweeksia sp.]|nr:hypothetical protein [Owenweeksia sp.]